MSFARVKLSVLLTVLAFLIFGCDSNADGGLPVTPVPTPAPSTDVKLTGISVFGEGEIEATESAELSATVTHTGDGYDAGKVTYAWSIIGIDDEPASSSEYATVSQNAEDGAKATVQATNATTSEHDVTIKIVATYDGNTENTATTVFIITIKAKEATVEDAVTAVAINAEKTEIDPTGTTLLTALPTKTGNPTITYTWTIVSGGDYAELSSTTGESVTLTGKNTTSAVQTVSVSVTASYTDKAGAEQKVSAASPAEIKVAAPKYSSDISVTVPVTDISLEAVANGAKLTVPAGISPTAITWFVNGTQAKAEATSVAGTYSFALGTDYAAVIAGTSYTIKAVVLTDKVDYTRSVTVEFSNE